MWQQFMTHVWPWHDQIAWAASLILALVGVVGIVIAVRGKAGQTESVSGIDSSLFRINNLQICCFK
jgi:hypothetical protein